MTPKPETRFIQQVHKKLSSAVYYEKMANPYRGGTADCYYETPNVLWIEYKFLSKLSKLHTLKLSKLQLRWLNRAYKNKVNVAVVLGWGEGRDKHGVIFTNPKQWTTAYTKIELINRSISIEALARWIENQ